MTALTAPPVQAWRFFDARVAAVARLSANFVRLTLAGPELSAFADNGWDQRFKLVLPDAHGSYDRLPRDPEWYAAWRQLPADHRNPIRTYTVRAVRPVAGEVDVDLVLHGDTGPASRFGSRARVGDALVVLGPNAQHDGAHGGVEFRPPAGHAGPTLLVGDATAVPAVCAILDRLPSDAFGEAVLTVPDAGDVVDVPRPAGFRVTWLAGAQQVRLHPAVAAALDRMGVPGAPAGAAAAAEPVPSEPRGDDVLWEVPDDPAAEGLYAWIAGEASLVTGLRRHLVRDLGVHRRAVAFMGYWRAGRASG